MVGGRLSEFFRDRSGNQFPRDARKALGLVLGQTDQLAQLSFFAPAPFLFLYFYFKTTITTWQIHIC